MPAPRTWTYERPRGCLPFAGAATLMCALLGVVAVVLGMDYGDPFWAAVMLVVVVVSLPAGTFLAFGRRAVVVDLDRQTVCDVVRVLLPVRERYSSLGDFHAVTILREKLRGAEVLSYLYHVRLVGSDPAVFVELAAPGDYEEARAVAVPLAEATGLPLLDGALPAR
ncbi:MAG: hypothetical protein HY904_01070 [Deltaproteobacteria bacterium]|nr:hypothetical protein [Deltaproteobacteria bacterium]